MRRDAAELSENNSRLQARVEHANAELERTASEKAELTAMARAKDQTLLLRHKMYRSKRRVGTGGATGGQTTPPSEWRRGGSRESHAAEDVAGWSVESEVEVGAGQVWEAVAGMELEGDFSEACSAEEGGALVLRDDRLEQALVRCGQGEDAEASQPQYNGQQFIK